MHMHRPSKVSYSHLSETGLVEDVGILAGWLVDSVASCVRLYVIDDHFRQRGAAIVCCSLVTLSSRSRSLSLTEQRVVTTHNTHSTSSISHTTLSVSLSTTAHLHSRTRPWPWACMSACVCVCVCNVVSLKSYATFKRAAWLWPWQSASACILSRVLEGRLAMASITCSAPLLLLFLLFQCCTITSTLQGNLSLSGVFN